MSQIEVQCDSCELIFDVPRSMNGGIANCPDCQSTVRIQSGPEPLYWMLVGLGVFVVLGISALVALASPIAALVVLLIGLGIVGLVAFAA